MSKARHPEKEVERVFRQRMRKMGWSCIKMNVARMYQGETGWPDRVCVSPYGFHVWVELKSDVGRLTATQVRRIDELLRHGAFVFVVHGMDEMNELVSMLETHTHAYLG